MFPLANNQDAREYKYINISLRSFQIVTFVEMGDSNQHFSVCTVARPV